MVLSSYSKNVKNKNDGLKEKRLISGVIIFKMDVHIFIVVSILIFFFNDIIFFLDGTNIALLSSQTSKNHTRFINIHIKLSKKRREREYICIYI